MTGSSHFDECGLAQLIGRLHDAFPGALKINYQAVCQLPDAAVLSEHDAIEIGKLGRSLVMLERGGFLVGAYFDGGEFHLFWECQLTTKGYEVARKLVQEPGDVLPAGLILSMFENSAGA